MTEMDDAVTVFETPADLFANDAVPVMASVSVAILLLP